MTTQVKRGKFEVVVVTSGELRSRSQTKITAPAGLTQIGIYQVKISRLVPEGTVVKKGDFVAGLDKSDIATKMEQQSLDLDKQQAEYTQAKLDTMLEMRAARDELVNLRYDLERMKLEKEQSRFEAPSVLQNAQLDYEKALRTLKQTEDNYKTKQIQAQTKMQIIGSDLAQKQNRMKQYTDVLSRMDIMAPKSGMVIYDKNWDGRKKEVGSSFQLWDGGTVATLPDLTQMEVVTYVNEVDMQKVKMGQKVAIGLDAAPEKKLQGIVRNVATIGQEKPNSDAKVFEVLINVLTKDSSLRPAMTTSCRISSEMYDQGLQIPLEAIYNDHNSSFVFTGDNGRVTKQEVKILTVNETSALISNGLSEGDKIYLSLPADTSGLKLVAVEPKNQMVPRQLSTIDTAMVRRMRAEESQEEPAKVKAEGKTTAAAF
ncbi:efflux RND transporter periplasmic adaptor subunit [Compostibacter hankyongensis]|uniref:Efflux RND transporter periplasmic adaptor subunit n=1 Tax=Compostibacter hankyongensis TaxID=1007089 RepID=A0ABP8FHG1_9BACT